MTTFRNPMRQLDFIVGYRLFNASRRFRADANIATNAFLNNAELSGLKSEVRKMKKV